MLIISKFLSRFKKKVEVDLPDKPKNIEIAPVYPWPCDKTVDSRVAVISSNDGFVFDAAGQPVEVTKDAHEITKKNFTPSVMYKEPGSPPWVEQQRIRNESQTVVVSGNVPVQNSVISSDQPGDVLVYNGYPITVNIEGLGNKIALINTGKDGYYNTMNAFMVTDSNQQSHKAFYVNTLNCDIYTAAKINELQGSVFYVNHENT